MLLICFKLLVKLEPFDGLHQYQSMKYDIFPDHRLRFTTMYFNSEMERAQNSMKYIKKTLHAGFIIDFHEGRAGQLRHKKEEYSELNSKKL